MTLIYTENTQFSLYYVEAAHLWGKNKTQCCLIFHFHISTCLQLPKYGD